MALIWEFRVPKRKDKTIVNDYYLEEKRSLDARSSDTRSLDTCSLDTGSIVSCLDEFNMANRIQTQSNESLHSMYMEVGCDNDLAHCESKVDNIDEVARSKKFDSSINNDVLQQYPPVSQTKSHVDTTIEPNDGDLLNVIEKTSSSEQMFFNVGNHNNQIGELESALKENINVYNGKNKKVRMKEEGFNKRSQWGTKILQPEEKNIVVQNNGSEKRVLSEENAGNKTVNVSYLRADQINKVSPFDDVPGFPRNSTQRQSFRNNEMLSTPSKLLNPNTNRLTEELSPKSVLVTREKWIQFEELNNPANQLSPSASPLTKFHTAEPPQSPSRHNWVSFNETMDRPDENSVVSSHLLNSEEDQDLVVSKSEKSLDITKATSVEDLLSVVNKTVSLIKHSITKPTGEQKTLFDQHKDEESELSDEVISLDYESEEERKKLRDTPVKQYTDVLLFQASSAAKNENIKNALNNSLKKQGCDSPVINQEKKLDDYPLNSNRNTWNFWYRYPDRKYRVSSRKWLPVIVKVEGDFIKLQSEQKNGLDILKEIPLHPFFVFTIPIIHRGNKDGRVHSVKLQYVKYRETHRLKTRVTLEHIPVYTPVFKLASRDIISLREFMNKVENIIRCIPTYRNKGITYRHEEIFIDSDDECQFLLSGDGDIVQYNITVQLRLRVFVTGSPDFKLFLNDVNCKDVLCKTKESLLRETKSSLRWIAPKKIEYHPCVDISKSEVEGGVVFVPPDGCSFELMRFRVHRKNTIPIIAKSSLELLSGNSVRLQASIQVSGDAKSIRHKRNDVVVYFPIPPSWSTLFVRSRTLNGTKKYIKTRGITNSSTPAIATLNRVTLQVSCGKAKYEPAMSSIAWRLGSLPVIQDGIPADAVHKFQCCLELPFPLEIRDDFQPYSYVEFTVAQQLASGVSVEEILLSDGRVPDKWVCYRSNYFYKISMKLIENGKVRERPAS